MPTSPTAPSRSELFDIAGRFAGNAPITEITGLGNGLINDTFRVSTTTSVFVLQRINRWVFPQPLKILDNLAALARHLARRETQTVKLRLPALIETTTHDNHYLDPDGELWRALEFIDNSVGLDRIGTPAEAEQVGFALAHFHRLLSDLPPEQLHDTLPGFHIAPGYLQRYRQIRDTAPKPPSHPALTYCYDLIDRHQAMVPILEQAKQQGRLKIRVIHGDPKLDNFLFDRDNRAVVSLIDPDTIKPGLIHYDLGDCLRSLCQTGEPAAFDTEICEAVLQGYLAEAGAFLTENDYRYIVPAIQLIPFELGLRFATDYLEGNRYFKVSEPEQNLQRAVRQFQLFESILQQQEPLKLLLKKLRRRQ